uniref:Uncharacterized protein n=1 Tax=Megaselia scalaris TaxID=36166 RepID=T1GC97_MEGSC
MVSVADQSVLLQYWHVFLPLFLLFAAFLYLQNKRELEAYTKASQKVREHNKLDGADLVAVSEEDIDQEDEFSPSLETKEHVPFKGAS